MKIRLEGKWVCSVCGSIWKNYYGLNNNESDQCESCGASPHDIHGVDERGEPLIEAEMDDFDKTEWDEPLKDWEKELIEK